MDLHALLAKCLIYCVFIGVPIGFVWWFIGAYRRAIKIEVQGLHKRNEPLLRRTLAAHGVDHFEVLRDSTSLGSKAGFGPGLDKPFQVHMIVHSPPSRWFVYVHVEGAEPVLAEITEQRALTAVG